MGLCEIWRKKKQNFNLNLCNISQMTVNMQKSAKAEYWIFKMHRNL
jgi:hypothetical protein